MSEVFILSTPALWIVVFIAFLWFLIGLGAAAIKYSEGEKKEGEFGGLVNEYALNPAVGLAFLGLFPVALLFIVDLVAYLINQF